MRVPEIASTTCFELWYCIVAVSVIARVASCPDTSSSSLHLFVRHCTIVTPTDNGRVAATDSTHGMTKYFAGETTCSDFLQGSGAV